MFNIEDRSIDNRSIEDRIYAALCKHESKEFAYTSIRRIAGSLSAKEADALGCGDIRNLERIEMSLRNDGMSWEDVRVLIKELESLMGVTSHNVTH